MSLNRRSVLELLGAFAAWEGVHSVASIAHAQQYPDRPVRIIVAFPPGASLDGAPRIVAQHVNSKYGWTIVVENRPGGGSQTGTLAGKNAPPDGYTLTAINGVSHGSALAIKRDPGYDPIKDFAPIALIGDVPLVMLVRSDVPARTVPEFIELLKQNPGKYNYGSGGFGTQHHLATAMLLDQARLPANIATHVPAQGLAPAITDLLAGNVQFMISSVGPAWQHVAAGKFRALAVTSAKRLSKLPDLPTMVELGFPDFQILAWSGLAAPAGTPAAILDRWNAVTNEALANDDVRKQLAGFDFDVRGGTRAEFASFIAGEQARYRKLGENAGLLAAN
jgi:tripartite-type tricarboxylate transporter receptor subunit TctC